VIYLYLDQFTGVRRRERAKDKIRAAAQDPAPELAPGVS